MKKSFLATALITGLSVCAMAGPATWEIDPQHANAQFVVRHMGISNVQGDFTRISGTVLFDEQDISKSSVNATIDVSSVDTRVPERDADLKSERFFDVAKYPTMTFQSKRIWSTGDGTAKMTGDLTIHGVTREVTFDVVGPSQAIKDRKGVTRRGVSATTKINRRDFGLVFSAAIPGGDLVAGNEIAIALDLEIVQK